MKAHSNKPADDLSNFESAYARLRRIAQKLLAGERQGHTLSATDVVGEAMARLLSAGHPLPKDGETSLQFVSHAARAMTEVLIDHSRKRDAKKRGGGKSRVHLDDFNDFEMTLDDRPDFDWRALDSAMSELLLVDPRRHNVMLLRFFAGWDNRRIAQELGVDERTVGRDFTAAKLWLKEKLSEAL